MNTTRKYRALKTKLFDLEIDQKELARKLQRSATYVSERMAAKRDWGLEDVYVICDLIGVPYQEIPVYFPKGGIEHH